MNIPRVQSNVPVRRRGGEEPYSSRCFYSWKFFFRHSQSPIYLMLTFFSIYISVFTLLFWRSNLIVTYTAAISTILCFHICVCKKILSFCFTIFTRSPVIHGLRKSRKKKSKWHMELLATVGTVMWPLQKTSRSSNSPKAHFAKMYSFEPERISISSCSSFVTFVNFKQFDHLFLYRSVCYSFLRNSGFIFSKE